MKTVALLLPLGLALIAGGALAAPEAHDGSGKGRLTHKDGKGPDGKGHGKGHDGKGHGACREDRQRLCSDVKGKAEIGACMLAHKAELSAACREKVEKREGMKADCRPDAEKYCSEVPPGRGRWVACLTGRKTDLQPACRKHVDAAIAKFTERRAKREKGKDKPAAP